MDGRGGGVPHDLFHNHPTMSQTVLDDDFDKQRGYQADIHNGRFGECDACLAPSSVSGCRQADMVLPPCQLIWVYTEQM